eukprot:3084013-Pyramimonas_sp.AAC.1
MCERYFPNVALLRKSEQNAQADPYDGGHGSSWAKPAASPQSCTALAYWGALLFQPANSSQVACAS